MCVFVCVFLWKLVLWFCVFGYVPTLNQFSFKCVQRCMCVCETAQGQNKSMRLHSPGVPHSREQHLVYSPNCLVLKITAQPTWRQSATSPRCSCHLHRDAITCAISTDTGTRLFEKFGVGLSAGGCGVMFPHHLHPHFHHHQSLSRVVLRMLFRLFSHLCVCGCCRCVRGAVKQ